MSVMVRSSQFDVLILASPRLSAWPSVGVSFFSRTCADYGLKVGAFGGTHMKVRGVISGPSTGGLAIVEDAQGRVHRLEAKAIIRVVPRSEWPDPFEGSFSPGLIPLSTARQLWSTSRGAWRKGNVVLGSGNAALRFASMLIENGFGPVTCIEQNRELFGKKGVAGWEVERRRFEMLGGKIVYGKPLRLTRKAAMAYEFRLEDAFGVRVLEAARIITCGPFSRVDGLRESPAGSLLFEFEQTSGIDAHDDVEGWELEEARASLLSVKIVRSLAPDLGARKSELEHLHRRSRMRVKQLGMHLEHPWIFGYQGKWLESSVSESVRAHVGTPKTKHLEKLVATAECFEDIACNFCQKACPEKAIDIRRSSDARGESSFLIEDLCTGCGHCLVACPSSAITLVHERQDQSMSQTTFVVRGERNFRASENIQLLNRKGDSLGLGRITQVSEQADATYVQVEVPSHLLWESRAIAKIHNPALVEEYEVFSGQDATAVEIHFEGKTRRVREGISAATALFELGYARQEDVLLCPDGSCQMCAIEVDGVKKLACRTKIRKGMALTRPAAFGVMPGRSQEAVEKESFLCPCLGLTMGEVIGRLESGVWKSPESAKRQCGIGEGKCHGAICRDTFRRLLQKRGLEAESWADWDIPWSDWVFNPGSEE